MAKDIFKGHFGIDLIAIVAIASSFFLGQYLAGTVILLMLSGGEALEDYALRRSSRELTRLLSLAPTVAHKKRDDEITDITVNEIQIGDILIVKPGETVLTDP
jgi:cation transport ATPase